MSIKNKIKELNKNKLNKLDLSCLKLKDGVPKELTKTISESKNNIIKVIELDLSFNQIKISQFLEDYGTMSNEFSSLETLNLSANQSSSDSQFNMSLIKSPTSIQRWNQLLDLNLIGCKLTKLQNSSFQHLTKLKKLSLSNNGLELIEDQCFSPFKLTLEELTLSGNSNLKHIPSSLFEFKQLEVLDLSGCSISQIPDTFGSMVTVLELNLGNNKLTELPNSIGRLKRLCFLNLQDNLIQDLPLSIGYCVGLGQSSPGINIYGNPLSKNQDLNQRKSRGAAEIMDYLEKRMTLHMGPIPLGTTTPPPSSTNTPQFIPSPMGNRPPSYEKMNQDRPPRYSSIGVSSNPPSSPPPNYSNPTHQQSLFNIPGPRPLKDQILTILRVDVKSTMKRILEAVSISNHVSPPIQLQQLVALGNIITPAQHELDKLFNCLCIPTDRFIFNSPIPNKEEDKLIQIKKIINLKLEKIALYSKSLLEYIDFQNQNQLNSPDYDKRISLIFNSLNLFNSKLNKI